METLDENLAIMIWDGLAEKVGDRFRLTAKGRIQLMGEGLGNPPFEERTFVEEDGSILESQRRQGGSAGWFPH